ncbi:hypothetical protein L208DRAFT_101531 [Tricholoma matsutake]|nr:hypothetical protein L208DRAFT_101531 [Tricholoma matsutake 945]
MSAKYRIGYYQVNIGIGDCEIVLLIKQTSTPKTEEIVKAVLIDGGDINVGENLRLNNVKLLIQTLAKDFNEPSGLKFDVIIITHWDLDHYKGVLELLFDDLLEREKKDITLPPRTPKTTRGRRVGIDRPGAVPYQVSFLKYDSSGNPQSMLYIPFERTRAAPYDVQYSPDPDGVFGFWASQFSRVCNFTADSAPPLPTGDPRTKPPEPIKPTDDSKIIGRELFSGTLHPDAQKAGNPATLVDLYKTGMPGLFCIMANNRYLKPDDDLTLDSKYDTTTLDNRSSIGCLIIWPGGAISHYFAGDMDAQQEEKIISWTGLSPEPTPATNPPPRPDVKNTVPIVKASHHGSSQSLPLRLCQCFKPSVILFSAGKAHNHPAWDRLFLMHAYIVNWAGAHTKTNADGTPRAPPVYLTAYPSYLYKSDLKIANATDYLRDGGKNGDYYRKIYGTFFEKFGDPTLNMVELFKSIDPAPDLSGWVQKELRMKILPTTTSIGDSAYPHNIDSGYVRDKLVSYIKVMYDDTGLQASSEYWEAHPHSNILVKRLAPATVLGPSAPKKKKVNLIDISNATGTGAEDDIDEDDIDEDDIDEDDIDEDDIDEDDGDEDDGDEDDIDEDDGDEDDGDEDYGDGDDNTTFFLTSSVVEVSLPLAKTSLRRTNSFVSTIAMSGCPGQKLHFLRPP